MSEQVLDQENWKNEAQAVINDIKDHVKSAEVSQKLQNTGQHVYINFTTLEGDACCVELSANGFRLVGKSYDTADVEGGQYFETPYGLLSQISANFYQSFGNALMGKLSALQKE